MLATDPTLSGKISTKRRLSTGCEVDEASIVADASGSFLMLGLSLDVEGSSTSMGVVGTEVRDAFLDPFGGMMGVVILLKHQLKVERTKNVSSFSTSDFHAVIIHETDSHESRRIGEIDHKFTNHESERESSHNEMAHRPTLVHSITLQPPWKVSTPIQS